MTIPTAPRTGLPTITIAVFDSATVFEGLTPSDVIYRYDLPGTGVTEGWAGTSVIDQVRQLAAQSWPDVHVRIDADAEATATLQRLLANKGVACSAAETDEPAPEEDPATGEFPPVGRHRLRGEVEPESFLRGRLSGERPGVTAVVVASAVLVLLVGAVVVGLRWWGAPGDGNPGPVAQVTGESSEATPPTTPRAQPTAPTSASEPAAAMVQLQLGDTAVSLPADFELTQSESSVIATGDDPDLRIHLTRDPVYSIGAGVLFDEVERLVEEDPQLSEPDRGEETMSYVEDPGDGSRVRWTTWVEGGNQLSVGCHTREQPSVSQHAACTMATRTFTVGGE